MRRTLAVVAVLALIGCSGLDADDIAAMEDAVFAELEDDDMRAALEADWGVTFGDGGDLRHFFAFLGLEGSGSRVKAITQLDEAETVLADVLCNLVTIAAYGLYGLDDMAVSGVDVVARGGRIIAHCVPRV